MGVGFVGVQVGWCVQYLCVGQVVVDVVEQWGGCVVFVDLVGDGVDFQVGVDFGVYVYQVILVMQVVDEVVEIQGVVVYWFVILYKCVCMYFMC